MSKKKSDDVDSEELGGRVPAVFARSFEQAEWYCQLLEDHDIPAEVDDEYEPPDGSGIGRGQGIPVLVPESMLADARTCIAQLEEIEGFDEDELDETEEDEFGPDEGFEAAADDEEEDEEDEKEEEDEEEEEEEEYF